MPLKSKQAKGERGVAGQVDNIALSRDLVDAVQSGVYIVQSRKFVYVNPFFAKLTGYSCEELIGTLSSKLVLPQDRPAVRKKAIRNLKSRLGSKPFEYRFIKKNSEIIWVMERVSSIEYMGQQAALGNCVDITERKRAEEALRENEEKYHNLFDNAMEAIFVAQAGKIVFLNPQMTKMTGYSSEEIMEKPFIDFVHPDDREMVFTENRRWLKQGTISSSYDFRGIKKNGDFTWAQFRAVLITWEGQPATLNFLEDITERKLAERELKQSSER
ncbi:MAG: PAS domain-containing protein [Chloroflexi bacterium]|nr:PAS domain-containing protein [Chloroflexota bacterium]